jgi:hypothetical protein
MKPFTIVAALACCLVQGCSRPAPAPSGILTVRATLASDAVASFAENYRDLRVSVMSDKGGPGAQADLAFAESGRALDSIGGTQGSAYVGGKVKTIDRVRPLRPFRSAGTAARPDIPAAATWYALWYDADRLAEAGIKRPDSIEELMANGALMKRAGMAPVALGASFGWPLALWFSYVDLRMNGAAASAERAAGERRFDDPGGIRAMAFTVELLKDGFFQQGADRKVWENAWTDMLDGRAAYCLMGSFAAERIPPGRNIRAIPVPAFRKGGSRDRGEVAVEYSFRVPGSSPNPHNAVALAMAFSFAGAPGFADGTIRLPAYIPTKTRLDGGLAILDEANRLVPPLEFALSTQGAYDSMRLFAELARNPGAWTPRSACEKLETIRSEGSKKK